MSNTFIVYVSNKAENSEPTVVRDIAIDSSRNNQMNNISGVLMGVGDHFLQVLEGESEVLDELLAKIEVDPRHRDLRVLYRGEMGERVFGRWSMGCVTPANESTGDLLASQCYFDDIAKELERLCESDTEDQAEKLKDLLIQIPQRLAEQSVSVN